MNEHIDIDRLLTTWFDDGPTVLPDRVAVVVADRIGRQPQRRAWRPDRRPTVNLFLKIALAAALGAAMLGGAVLDRRQPFHRTVTDTIAGHERGAGDPGTHVRCHTAAGNHDRQLGRGRRRHRRPRQHRSPHPPRHRE